MKVRSSRASFLLVSGLLITSCNLDPSGGAALPAIEAEVTSTAATSEEVFVGQFVGRGDTLVTLEGSETAALKWWWGGATVHSTGRLGDGPGELRSAGMIIPLSDSTFAVLEHRGRRINRFGSNGAFLGRLRFDSGPFLISGRFFSGLEGKAWFLEDGAPRRGTTDEVDSVRIWLLVPETGRVRLFGRAAGGGRSTAASGSATVSVPTPLWTPDLLVQWSPESLLVLDPRQGLIRVLGSGDTAAPTVIVGLSRRPVPASAKDSIRDYWRNHPNPVFREVQFDIPGDHAYFDEAVRGSGEELWLRASGTTGGSVYLVVQLSQGRVIRRVEFPGNAIVRAFDADSMLVHLEDEGGDRLVWARLPR